MSLSTYLPAILLAGTCGLLQWASWRWIGTAPAEGRMTQEAARIVVWMVGTFVFQLSMLVMGIFFLREISGVYLSLWGIVFLGITSLEILRLHRGTNLS